MSELDLGQLLSTRSARALPGHVEVSALGCVGSMKRSASMLTSMKQSKALLVQPIMGIVPLPNRACIVGMYGSLGPDFQRTLTHQKLIVLLSD